MANMNGMLGSLRLLIRTLTIEGVLKTPSIVDALKEVDRKDFVPSKYKSNAYDDFSIPIGSGQTVPQPYTTVFMLEHLKAKRGDRILDVGSGSGWATALLGHIVGERGQVYGVEIVPELVSFGRRKIKKYDYLNIQIFQAGNTLGLPEYAPYDRILVSACSETIPEVLVEQLKIGGCMIIPIDDSICRVRRVSNTKTTCKRYKGFAFVPLVY